MDEVDKIILVSLAHIGCEIPQDVTSLKEFNADMIVEGVARGLKAIDSKLEFATKLPPEMSSKYRHCSALAKACQELGYRGELGYHQFLYPNENESRRLLMWLVEMLPKIEVGKEQEVMGSLALLERSIASEVTERLRQGWLPPEKLNKGLYSSGETWNYRSPIDFRSFYCVPVYMPQGTGNVMVQIPKELQRYHDSFLKFATYQPSTKKDVAASLLQLNSLNVVANQEWEAEWNKNGLQSGLSADEYKKRKRAKLQSRFNEQLKAASQRAARADIESLEQIIEAYSDKTIDIGSRFSRQAKFATEEEVKVETEEELQRRRQEELQQLRDRLQELTVSLSQMETDMTSYQTNIKQLENQLRTEQTRTQELERIYKLKKPAFDLLDDPEGNTIKLNEKIASLSKLLLELAAKWEERRQPLVEEYRALKDKHSGRLAESMKKLEEIKEFRVKMKELAEEIRQHTEFHAQLAEEYERLPKDTQRSMYTTRILEIVNNVQKQNMEIDKVLNDTRQLSREAASSDDVLQRTYTATDELLYRDAKKEEFSKRGYKLLVGIHKTCEKILEIIEETGRVKNTTRELEEKIAQLQAEKISQNLDKIMGDYNEVVKENEELEVNIKKAGLGVF